MKYDKSEMRMKYSLGDFLYQSFMGILLTFGIFFVGMLIYEIDNTMSTPPELSAEEELENLKLDIKLANLTNTAYQIGYLTAQKEMIQSMNSNQNFPVILNEGVEWISLQNICGGQR